MQSQSLHILVVDDAQIILALFSQAIKDSIHTVVTVQSYEQALDALAEETFDLAFFDVYLPDGDGVNLMQKANELYPDITVVAMTGITSREEEVRIREQRVACFLIKPFSYYEFFSIINHHAAIKTKSNLHPDNNAIHLAANIRV